MDPDFSVNVCLTKIIYRKKNHTPKKIIIIIWKRLE